MCLKLTLVVFLVAVGIGSYISFKRLPGENGLGFFTTADEAIRTGVNLEGKNILITGGYRGIGFSTTETLAKYRANIYLPARRNSLVECQQIATKISLTSSNPNIFCEEMDLSSFRSIKAYTESWKQEHRPLHLLILNAGIGSTPFNETEDGFETIWQSNHLGHFLLTYLLMDNLKKGAPCRVVVVSSQATWPITWDDISGKGTWHTPGSWLGPIFAYCQSKTANILFARKLNELLKGHGVANSLHPGTILTNINRNDLENPIIKLTNFVAYYEGKTMSQGAATQLYLATAPEIATVGGLFWNDCNVEKPPSYADSKELAERLWDISMESVKKWTE